LPKDTTQRYPAKIRAHDLLVTRIHSKPPRHPNIYRNDLVPKSSLPRDAASANPCFPHTLQPNDVIATRTHFMRRRINCSVTEAHRCGAKTFVTPVCAVKNDTKSATRHVSLITVDLVAATSATALAILG